MNVLVSYVLERKRCTDKEHAQKLMPVGGRETPVLRVYLIHMMMPSQVRYRSTGRETVLPYRARECYQVYSKGKYISRVKIHFARKANKTREPRTC